MANRAVLAALVLAIVIACTRNASVTAEPLNLSLETRGLQEIHRKQIPLVEMVFCIPPEVRPGEATCNTSRVYPDGAYYLLQSTDAPGGSRWAYLSSLRPEGVRELEVLFAAICNETDPVHGNDEGSSRYLVTAPGCTRELVVTGVPAEGLRRLNEVQDIVGRNMNKIPPGP